MTKLWVSAGESNRMDVKICRKLEFLSKSWYFIGNKSKIAGPIYQGKYGQNRKIWLICCKA
jgi:hypothetical protein